MTSFVLVHSPVVGPSTWRWVAEDLGGIGHRAVVPLVPESVTSRGWEDFADSVAGPAGDDDQAILLRHSGAGLLLRQISARSRRAAGAFVFVDAGVPPPRGEAEVMPAEIFEELRPITSRAMLRPRSEWFGRGADVVLPGAHLDIVTRPAAIADAILSVVAQLPGCRARAVRSAVGWVGAGRRSRRRLLSTNGMSTKE